MDSNKAWLTFWQIASGPCSGEWIQSYHLGNTVGWSRQGCTQTLCTYTNPWVPQICIHPIGLEWLRNKMEDPQSLGLEL